MYKKASYSLEILYNKWSPFIISGLLIIGHIIHFCTSIDIEWLQYICLPSIFTSLHMYNSRVAFKFCKVHRCFVNYVVCNIPVTIIEHYWVIPYMNIGWFSFVILGTLFTILLGFYYYKQEHGKDSNRPSEENSK